MQTKSNISASQIDTRTLVNVAKQLAPDETLTVDQEGPVKAAGRHMEASPELLNLLQSTGNVTGHTLRTMALTSYAQRLGENAKMVCIVFENHQGKLKVYTQAGIMMLDGLSRDIIALGGVYLGYVDQNGFALIRPEDEITPEDASVLMGHFGRLPPFVFQAVWGRIREREENHVITQTEEHGIQSLQAGQAVTLGTIG